MKNIPTVHELRKAGYKVKVGHFRNFFKYNPQTGKKTSVYNILFSEWKESYSDFYLNTKGGRTLVTIKPPNSSEEYEGSIECSIEERYVKNFGTKRAIARALAKIKN
jgi:hypothetical protein